MPHANPLTAKVDEASAVLADVRASARELRDLVSWFDACDRDDLSKRIADAEAISLARAGALRESQKTTESLELEIQALKSTRSEYKSTSFFTIPGAVWELISAGRSTMRRRQELRFLRSALRENASEEAALADAVEKAADTLGALQAERVRYLAFQRTETIERVIELESEVASREAQLASLAFRAAALDEELRDPTAMYDSTARELARLQSRIDAANGFVQDLQDAATPRERALVHRACESELGTSRPQEFIREHRPSVARLRRDAQKQERLIETIVRRGTIDPKRFVLDGSNLCFEGKTNVGLWPLRALHDRLSQTAEVVALFDFTIVNRLGLRDSQALKEQLPGIDARVVAARVPADETILDEAQAEGTYVISNDRYSEFQHKGALREARILGFEIHDGRIRVPDLRVDIPYPRTY